MRRRTSGWRGIWGFIRIHLNIKWHEECLERYKRLKDFVEGVPEDILNLDVTFDIDYGKKITMCGFGGEKTYIALKVTGVVGLRKKLLYEKEWGAKGTVLLNSKEIGVTIYSVEQPPNCHIEEYTVTETKYKAICEETGEEIK